MKFKNIDFAEVENIVFDFGKVLLDIDLNRTINAFEALGLECVDPSSIHPHNSGVFLQLELGEISRSEFCDALRMTSKSAAVISDEQIFEAWNATLLEYDFARFELILKLRASGYKVYLLSNTNEPHHACFEDTFNRENPFGMTFKGMFDGVFYSDEMKMRKPNSVIYEEVARLANLNVERTIFVDDNAPNLVAPAALGWNVYHLTGGETVLDLFQ